MANSSIGTDNTLIGNSSGSSITTGSRNIAIGQQTLFTNSTANNNVAIGYQSLYNCAAANNVALGFTAGYSCTSGGNNVFIGDMAGRGTTPITTGGSNTYIGASAFPSSSASSGEIVIGSGIGSGSNTARIIASNGLFVSNLTSGLLKSTSGKIGQASSSDFVASITGTLNQINVSASTGAITLSLSSSPRFAYIGSSTVGSQNVLIGDGGGGSITNGGYNVAIGQQALQSGISCQGNVAVGYVALNQCTADSNTAVGSTSGFGVTTGYNNVFIGNSSGRGNFPLTTGAFDCYIGVGASPSASNVNREIVIGDTAGKGENTAMIRADSGLHVSNLSGGILTSTSTGKIQRSTGTDFISNTGTNNVLLGSNPSITTGSYNVHLGVNTQTSSNSVTNEIVIGSQSTTTTGRGTNTCFINAPSGFYSYIPAYCQLVATAFNDSIVTWEFWTAGSTTHNIGFSLQYSNTRIIQPFQGLYEVNISGTVYGQASLFADVKLNVINMRYYSIAYQSSSAINGWLVNVSGSQITRPHEAGYEVSVNGARWWNSEYPLYMTIKFISL